MIFFIAAVFIFIITVIFIFFSKHFKILSNYTGEKHQAYTSSKRVPLVGGSIAILFVITFTNFDLYEKLFCLSLFIIGFLSDLKIIISPRNRFIIQIFVVIFFLYMTSLHLVYTRFQLLDFALSNIYFSYFFTALCILILINGTNFIDGNNFNVLGYYLIISLILFFLNAHGNFFSINNNIYLIELIFILSLLNITNRVYLGDGGSFLLGGMFGFILIQFYLNNLLKVSSFFIILLLWYPAFENLFSIIRKFYFSKSPIAPDNNHFHHLLFFLLKKKLNKNKIFLNNAVGVLINLYNFLILFTGALKPNNTQFLVCLIFVNLIIYILIYLKLFKYKKKFN